MANKNNFIKIKIPVFISDISESGMFTNQTTIDGLIEDLITSKINVYNNNSAFIKKPKKRGKQPLIEIRSISPKKVSLNGDLCLMLKVEAVTFNKELKIIRDNFPEARIDKTDKIGDDKNYIFLYPRFIDLEKTKHKWLILSYDDDTRDSEDLIFLTKQVANEILRINIKNIKLGNLLDEVKDELLSISYTLNYEEVDVNPSNDELKSYHYETKRIIKEVQYFSNMPLVAAFKNLLRKTPSSKPKNRKLKIERGDKEYIINQEPKNFNDDLNSIAEIHFNYSHDEPEINKNKIHNEDFMLRIINGAVTKYLTNNGED